MILNVEGCGVVFQRTSSCRAGELLLAAPVKTAGNLATFLDVPMLALHTMHSGPPELADQLPALGKSPGVVGFRVCGWPGWAVSGVSLRALGWAIA